MRLNTSNESGLSTPHFNYRNFWILLRREFLYASNYHKIEITLFIQVIIQSVILYLIITNDNITRQSFDLLQKFAVLWLCILAILFSSTSITSETESKIIEFLKLSSLSENEFIVSKLIFIYFQFILFSSVFITMTYFYSLALGSYILYLSLILLFGPYLLIFTVSVLLLLSISALSKNKFVPIGIGCSIPIYQVFLNSTITGVLGIKNYNPAFIIDKELMSIKNGTNPNYLIWIVILIVIIIQIIGLILIIKRYWKGVKE